MSPRLPGEAVPDSVIDPGELKKWQQDQKFQRRLPGEAVPERVLPITDPEEKRKFREQQRRQDEQQLADVRASLGAPNKDEAYSKAYWGSLEKKLDRKGIDSMRQTIREYIEEAVKTTGSISLLVDKTIDEKDKAKMSAYRALAAEMGYEVGQFSVNKNSGTATAEIKTKNSVKGDL